MICKFVELLTISLIFQNVLSLSEENFDQYLVKYNRTYVKEIYLQNDRKFRELFLPISKNGIMTKNLSMMQNSSLSLIWDWRDKKAVTSVKNQQACGACWAFSVVETVESMRAIKYGYLHELSVQEVIDCSPSGQSCEGGDTCSTAKWLVNEHVNVLNKTDYPLKDTAETCRLKPVQKGTTVNNYSCLNFVGNEINLLNLIETYGPVTAAVDATLWQDYTGGIIQHHCYDTVNHAVEIVGFNQTGPVPYYIVRNSWGTLFGNNGYAYVKIGLNMCGIAQQIVTVGVD